MEAVADDVIKAGAFYLALIPEDIKIGFTEDGSFELYYDSLKLNELIQTKVTVQLSEKYEIESKERNILSDEFQSRLKINRIAVVFLYSIMISVSVLGVISIFGLIATIISCCRKERDKNQSNKTS